MTRFYGSGATDSQLGRTALDWQLTGLYGHWIDQLQPDSDIIVRVARGTSAGAPGVWWPEERVIELDGRNAKPDTNSSEPSDSGLDLADITSLARIAVLHGVAVHEAAHAAHTTLTPDSATDAAVWSVATLLEESRIERAAVEEDPDNAMWLAAAVEALLDAEQLGNVTAALLLLSARADAGVLEPNQVEALNEQIVASIGTDLFDQLRGIWQQAQTVEDSNPHQLLQLAGMWVALLQDNNQPPPPPPPESGSGDGQAGGETGDSSKIEDMARRTAAAVQDASSDTIAEAISLVDEQTAGQAELDAAAHQRAAEKAERQQERQRNKQQAESVFGGHGKGHAGHSRAVVGWRQPTTCERATAGRLASRLEHALWRPDSRAVVPTRQPGGNLDHRGAVALSAQRELGLALTARNWRQTRTQHNPPLRLHVGVALDRSGSMRGLVDATASAAWVVATASRSVGARFAAVTFGERTEPLCQPGSWPHAVPKLDANAGWESIGSAVSALDGALDLHDDETIRLLFIFSDCHWVQREQDLQGRAHISRLARSGCRVIAANSGSIRPVEGAEALQVRADDVGRTIADQIIEALHARR